MLRTTCSHLEPVVLQAVLDRIAAGVSNAQIYTQTGVSRDCTALKRQNLAYWGQPYAPALVKIGRPLSLQEQHRTQLREYLAGRPQAYLEEIRDWILEEFGILVSIATVSCELKQIKWSRKIASKKAAEQSDALRRVFQARCQQNYTAEQIVAVDESACNERTGDRKYGWSPVGQSVLLSYSMKRSERWSLLPAMTVDGYLAHRIFQGAITAEYLEEFLRNDVLPHLTPGYHVLLLDNASIHRSPAIVQLCRDYRIQLEYLPPYSPDYNPTKKTFKVLKSWMKRHHQQQDEWLDFCFFMELAVLNSCFKVDCRSWYRKCGYVGVDDA
jgi:transposase